MKKEASMIYHRVFPERAYALSAICYILQ